MNMEMCTVLMAVFVVRHRFAADGRFAYAATAYVTHRLLLIHVELFDSHLVSAGYFQLMTAALGAHIK